MAYDKTKRFLIEQAKKEPFYQIDYLRKKRERTFTESEIFCLNLCYLTKKISEKPTFFNPQPILRDMGVIRRPDGWFEVDKSFGKGRFINANAIFKNVLCEENACHDCAFSFASSYHGDVKLKSGIINPYHLNSGILHSICEFEMGFRPYVFDGANFLVMDKDLYYALFDFHEIQTIGQRDLWQDISLISKASSFDAMVKSNRPYLPAKNWRALEKHFDGMGFLLYLYDRDASINSDLPPEKQAQRNKDDMQQLEEGVAIAKEEVKKQEEDILF